jgi:hypothetical protein
MVGGEGSLGQHLGLGHALDGAHAGDRLVEVVKMSVNSGGEDV